MKRSILALAALMAVSSITGCGNTSDVTDDIQRDIKPLVIESEQDEPLIPIACICEEVAFPIEETTVTEVTEVTEAVTTPAPEDEMEYYDIPLDHALQDYISELCESNGVPMSLIIAMIEVESYFTSDVISKTNDWGLMQINAINHGWLSEEYGITNFLDPYQNVRCGIEMISKPYNKYKSVTLALMVYNLGENGAKRRWNEGIYETSYSRKILSIMEEYEDEIK